MTPSTTPRPVVRTFWHGGLLQPLQLVALGSFVDHGYVVELFAYDDIQNRPPGVVLRDAREVMPESMVFAYADGFGKGSFAACANIFRYRMVNQLGGWWVDTDVICLGKIEPEQGAAPYVFVEELRKDGPNVLANCLFKSPAQEPFLDYCIREAESRDRTKIKWTEIGPILFDQSVRRHGLDRWIAPRAVYSPINFDEIHKFLEPGLQLPGARTVHLWNSVWKANQVDLHADYPKDSIFGRLKERHLG
jgi:hypothetical protein